MTQTQADNIKKRLDHEYAAVPGIPPGHKNAFGEGVRIAKSVLDAHVDEPKDIAVAELSRIARCSLTADNKKNMRCKALRSAIGMLDSLKE